MQIDDFKKVVATFADPPAELLVEKSELVFSMNGDPILARISTRDGGEVYVSEGDEPIPATSWILKRLARVPLLAARLKEAVADTPHFVAPQARILSTLSSTSTDDLSQAEDALDATLRSFESRSPLETMVMYIVSGAGEGKTSLINQLARQQAQRYLDNKTSWLLVPIPLGGRHFLRFDDITVGALQNRYRFPFLYYNSFLALVQMGVIVPAFDGFEEMFVETSSGEALSAMGILLASLDSKGAVLVAARKAYFDFENIHTQERLLGSIRTLSVGFGKVELERWSRHQFISYCDKRGVQDPEILYDRVVERLGAEHPLLTRAVLVRRLIDLAIEHSTLEKLLRELAASGLDYFPAFIDNIIEREANEKWLDRSGENDVGTPLLTLSDHRELLSQIALSMWESQVDFLRLDHLEFVADYFSESARKPPFQAQQIRKRIRDHALLVPTRSAPPAIEFDHDEFRLYFLGVAIASQARQSADRAKADLLSAFRRGVLPHQARDALVSALTRAPIGAAERVASAKQFLSICAADGQASYTQENCSEIILRLLNGISDCEIEIVGVAFGADALRDKKLAGVVFRDCFFGDMTLENTEINDCRFERCRLARLRLNGTTTFRSVFVDDCEISAVSTGEGHREIRDPAEVNLVLGSRGIEFKVTAQVLQNAVTVLTIQDDETIEVEKLVRYFSRCTQISDKVILMKFGERGPHFIDDTLPDLIRVGAVAEIGGGGKGQRRFRLGMSMDDLNDDLQSASGSYESLLTRIGKRRGR